MGNQRKVHLNQKKLAFLKGKKEDYKNKKKSSEKMLELPDSNIKTR